MIKIGPYEFDVNPNDGQYSWRDSRQKGASHCWGVLCEREKVLLAEIETLNYKLGISK